MKKAGRPKKDDKKIMVCVKLPPDIVEWLRSQGKSQSVLIEEALRKGRE